MLVLVLPDVIFVRNSVLYFHDTFGRDIFLHSGRQPTGARRPAVQNVFVIAQGHGVGHASPIEAAGQ